jgi:hypothetical protein
LIPSHGSSAHQLGITPSATPFKSKLRIFPTKNAEQYAADLFWKSFNAPFPVPRTDAGLPISTPEENWHQYVASYAWEEGNQETVGFCNWIKHDEVYLEGGLCVAPTFYRRLPREELRECAAAGGIAQLLMEAAALELTDCKAWFAHCGDAKALAVVRRVGFVPTEYEHVIVKWFAELPEPDRRRLAERVARIGPF